MKPNSKTRAAKCIHHTAYTSTVFLRLGGHRFEVPWGSHWAAEGGSKTMAEALAKEFRAVRRQTLLSAAKAVTKRADDAADLPGYVNGLDDAAHMLREMAAPKRRKGP